MPRFLSSFFAHGTAPGPLTAYLEHWMKTKKRSKLFNTRKPLHGLYLKNQTDGGKITNSNKGFEQIYSRQRTFLSHNLCLRFNDFFLVKDLLGGGNNHLGGGFICSRGYAFFGISN